MELLPFFGFVGLSVGLVLYDIFAHLQLGIPSDAATSQSTPLWLAPRLPALWFYHMRWVQTGSASHLGNHLKEIMVAIELEQHALSAQPRVRAHGEH